MPERWQEHAKAAGGAGARAARRVNESSRLQVAVRFLREALPGDSAFGDPLSTAGDTPNQVVLRRLSDATQRRPGLLREVGMSALQLWQAAAEAQGRGRGNRELAIAFTDLEGFSSYSLRAGDEASVALLRRVGRATEPAIRDAGGRVVKRLGDGVMAVFDDPRAGLEALRVGAAAVEARGAEDGYRPRLRAGLHVGRPRKLAGDFFGVDVNVAARLAETAAGGEILVSETVRERADCADLAFKRKRRFGVKGVPSDLSAYRLTG